jgi:hypothetical protein
MEKSKKALLTIHGIMHNIPIDVIKETDLYYEYVSEYRKIRVYKKDNPYCSIKFIKQE